MLITQLRQQWSQFRADRFIAQSKHQLVLRDMPSDLFLYWQDVAPAEFPGIPQNAFFSPGQARA